MTVEKTRVMIVDDADMVRHAFQKIVELHPDFEVVATARDGREAVEKARRFRPQLITLDVMMPVMDGLEALEIIMRECPARVLMISGATSEGAEATLEALSRGAVDFLTKPVQSKELLAKLRAIAAADAAGKLEGQTPPALASSAGGGEKEIVLIGTSTGGPSALQTLLPRLPDNLGAGVLIVQHMPPAFTGQLARRLDSLCALRVKEAREGDRVLPGQVLLAPGNRHLVLRRRAEVGLDEEPSTHPHRPSVDVLLASAVPFYGPGALGIILTGMGEDGKAGAEALKAGGGAIIAQDRDTSVVYGMPRAVVEAGLADQVRPLKAIAPLILEYVHP